MKEQLKRYIKNEIEKLKFKGDEISLSNVYPSILEEVLGDFNEPYDLNGYDCDYWANTSKYSIWGSMRFGTAKITLREEEKEELVQDIVKEIPQKPLILRIEDVPDFLLEKLKTFYFTFGGGQTHQGHYQPIMAIDSKRARNKMVEIYGREWAFDYNEEQWKSAGKYYIGKGLETIVTLEGV